MVVGQLFELLNPIKILHNFELVGSNNIEKGEDFEETKRGVKNTKCLGVGLFWSILGEIQHASFKKYIGKGYENIDG